MRPSCLNTRKTGKLRVHPPPVKPPSLYSMTSTRVSQAIIPTRATSKRNHVSEKTLHLSLSADLKDGEGAEADINVLDYRGRVAEDGRLVVIRIDGQPERVQADRDERRSSEVLVPDRRLTEACFTVMPMRAGRRGTRLRHPFLDFLGVGKRPSQKERWISG